MKFDVAYRTADGKMAETTIEVADRNAVYSELRRQGITPISLHEAGTKKRDKKSDGGKLSGALKIVLLAVLLSAAVFAAWYFLAADDGALGGGEVSEALSLGVFHAAVGDDARRRRPAAVG